MRMREDTVEEQIQQILLFETAGEFLAELKKEFRGKEEEIVKVAELRRIEQRGKTIKEFVQEFKRAARESRYEGRPSIEEFKWGMNRTARQDLQSQSANLTPLNNGMKEQSIWIKTGGKVGETRKD